METIIKESIKEALPQLPQSSNQEKNLESFDEIIIPEDEREKIISEVLYQWRKKKFHENKHREYWNSVYTDKQYPKYAPTELQIMVRQQFVERNRKPFIVDKDNGKIFLLLCQYFTADKAFEENPGLSLSKGILLYGDVGTGKTELMKMFLLNQHQSYGIVGCRSITDAFTNEGGEEVEKYFTNRKNSIPHKFGQEYSGYCFDDLGTEAETVIHYGNRKNMMAEIILNRYDSKMNFPYTHITTNLTTSEIEHRYGTRCTDRMKQMFNIITFPAHAKSRR
ncbi:MAG: hypothetical protein ACEQSL_01615 [Sediminibacterium sp.]